MDSIGEKQPVISSYIYNNLNVVACMEKYTVLMYIHLYT